MWLSFASLHSLSHRSHWLLSGSSDCTLRKWEVTLQVVCLNFEDRVQLPSNIWSDLYWSLHQSLALHKRGQICCMVNSCLHVAFGSLKKPSSGVLDPVATSYLYVLALLLFWSVQTVNGRFNKGLMHQIKLHCLKIPGNIPPSIITIHICTMW